MNRKESVRLFLSVHRPGGARKKGPLWGIASRILGGQKPNKQRTIEDRTFDALRSFEENIHFLVGVLTVIPFLKPQNSMLEFEAEQLLLDGQNMSRRKPELRSAFIRRLRVREEKILRLVEKIEKTGRERA